MADGLAHSEAAGAIVSSNVLDHLLAACKGLFRERRQAVINLASSETAGVTTNDDVLDPLFALCEEKLLAESRQTAASLKRAEQERDEARAELETASMGAFCQMKKYRADPSPLQEFQLEGLQNSIVVCLLDGDGAIPVSDRLKQGFQGGQQAAKDLQDHLFNYIKQQGLSPTNTSLVVFTYCKQKGLRDTLVGNKCCEERQFWQFWTGFQSTDLFCMIDVGQKKESVDAKIRAAMLFYARMPQVSHLFLGVTHDGGYHHPLSTLILEGHRKKVVLLRSYIEDLPRDIGDLHLTEDRVDGLFMENRLPSVQTPRWSNDPLPSSPKGATFRGGRSRAASFASGVPPSRLGLSENDVPLRTSAVENRPTSVETPPQGHSLLFESGTTVTRGSS